MPFIHEMAGTTPKSDQRHFCTAGAGDRRPHGELEEPEPFPRATDTLRKQNGAGQKEKRNPHPRASDGRHALASCSYFSPKTSSVVLASSVLFPNHSF